MAATNLLDPYASGVAHGSVQMGGHSLIFGLDDPVDPKQIVPDAKATLSLNGKQNVGGLIARDYAGGLLLAHGGFVGGKIGVGKTAFRKAYGGPKCLVQFEIRMSGMQ
jgi:hypothetical protein